MSRSNSVLVAQDDQPVDLARSTPGRRRAPMGHHHDATDTTPCIVKYGSRSWIKAASVIRANSVDATQLRSSVGGGRNTTPRRRTRATPVRSVLQDVAPPDVGSLDAGNDDDDDNVALAPRSLHFASGDADVSEGASSGASRLRTLLWGLLVRVLYVPWWLLVYPCVAVTSFVRWADAHVAVRGRRSAVLWLLLALLLLVLVLMWGPGTSTDTADTGAVGAVAALWQRFASWLGSWLGGDAGTSTGVTLQEGLTLDDLIDQLLSNEVAMQQLRDGLQQRDLSDVSSRASDALDAAMEARSAHDRLSADLAAVKEQVGTLQQRIQGLDDTSSSESAAIASDLQQLSKRVAVLEQGAGASAEPSDVTPQVEELKATLTALSADLDRLRNASGEQAQASDALVADVAAAREAADTAKELAVAAQGAVAAAQTQADAAQRTADDATVVAQEARDAAARALAASQNVSTTTTTVVHEAAAGSSGVTIEQVREEVAKAILTERASRMADDLPSMDWALASAGARVVPGMTSPTLQRSEPLVSGFLGSIFKKHAVAHAPETVLSADVSAGECWAFAGAQGHITISLHRPIQATSFSLRHLSSRLVTRNTAPKQCEVWGVSDLSASQDTWIKLASFAYDATASVPLVEVAAPKNSPAFQHYQLKVLSNHGDPEWTCLYRFSVHGNAIIE